MKKTEKRERSETGRVLARVLAEDLRNINGAIAPANKIEITYDDGHGHMDMTNFPNDGYN